MEKGYFKIEHVERKVFRASFLKNVTYAITLADATFEEARLKEFMNSLDELGYNAHHVSDPAKGMILVKKKGVDVLCNREFFLLNVQAKVYENFEHYKENVLNLFRKYSEAIKAKMVKSVYIMKTNEFSMDRTKPELVNVTKEQFEQVVCSAEFIRNADDREIQIEEDTRSLLAKSNLIEREKEFILQLVIAILENKECELNQIESRLNDLNDAAYDIWSAVLSDTMKETLQENENK